MNKCIHHTKYLEIDGVDEIVLSNKSEHLDLHGRTRKSNGQFDVNPNKIDPKISEKAYSRIYELIDFYTLIERGVGLTERIRYNPYLGTIGYSSRFEFNSGKI